MSITLSRTELGVHVATVNGQTFTGYFGEVKDIDGVTVARYDNSGEEFVEIIHGLQITDYVGKHRSRMTLRERLRLVRLGFKRSQEWPTLVKHVATTPAMQQVPYDWTAIDF